jgi:hypothetical protein
MKDKLDIKGKVCLRDSRRDLALQVSKENLAKGLQWQADSKARLQVPCRPVAFKGT